MDAQGQLLSDIEAFITRHGLSETTFGRNVVNDGKFVRRLRDGGGVTLITAERVRAYMRERNETAA